MSLMIKHNLVRIGVEVQEYLSIQSRDTGQGFEVWDIC